ncbi:hypothetical protein [Herbiconiux ginsengi]|uniref:hypothetical protein n=1 Tax=Herbiconiux ginsengi TaxID=381665 RepID=UPI001C313049|nr:hypothetical protein [Herbiconiux ginsengi]
MKATGLTANKPTGLAPSLWAQRMQVKLEFQDIAPRCPSGQAQTLTSGSEMLTAGMTSWIPGICAGTGVALGYSQLSDFQARQQLSGGSSRLAFGSQPATGDGLVNAPVALGAVVVGVNLDYQPCGGSEEVTEGTVARCGYPDLETAQREHDRNGEQITELNLNSRLVAKLLTMSYGAWGDIAGSSTVPQSDPVRGDRAGRAPWVADQPTGLISDQEFLALNPALKYQISDSNKAIYRINVESLRSDAAHQLWSWLATDPLSKSFLNGCPDQYGTVINPFYSTRTYAECPDDASELSEAAAAKIEATHSPVGFDQTRAPSYPPTSTAYPQVLWYQQDPYKEGAVTWGAATVVDLFPPLASMPVAARGTFQAAIPKATWCPFEEGIASCKSNRPGGEWKGLATRQDFGTRNALSITSAADAARFQLPTARICDDDGANCIGATEATLTTALASGFSKDTASGMLLPNGQADLGAGAYPLAMLVYGVVNTKGLAQPVADALADALDYLAGPGQIPGTTTGQLAPGYAPLSEELVAEATAATALLRNPPPASAAPPKNPAPNAPVGPRAAFVPKAVVPPPAPNGGAPDSDQAPVAAPGGVTGATETGFPQLGLLVGLGAAVLAGAFSFVIGRRKKVRA